MVVTSEQARAAIKRNGEKFQLTASDMNAGRDDNSQVDSGEIGELATAEVGSDGQLSGYNAVLIGQPADSPNAKPRGNEAFVDLETGADGEAGDTVEWAIAARRKGELGGGNRGNITGFISNRSADDTDPRKRPVINPSLPVVRDGRVLQMLIKDETSNITIELTNCSWTIPAIGGEL